MESPSQLFFDFQIFVPLKWLTRKRLEMGKVWKLNDFKIQIVWLWAEVCKFFRNFVRGKGYETLKNNGMSIFFIDIKNAQKKPTKILAVVLRVIFVSGSL